MRKFHATILQFLDEIAVIEVWAYSVDEATTKAEALCSAFEHVGFVYEL